MDNGHVRVSETSNLSIKKPAEPRGGAYAYQQTAYYFIIVLDLITCFTKNLHHSWFSSYFEEFYKNPSSDRGTTESVILRLPFFFFFFFMKSNARRGAPEWCSLYVSRKILVLPKRRESWSSERVEAWVFVNQGFEDLKITSAGKDGGRERVPVPWSHRDKRISEWSGPALF